MHKEYLDFAISIAMEAKKINEKYFDKAMESGYKNDKTIVTVADKEINDYLIQRVKEVYPTHAVDGEEEKFGDSSYKWVCDPVDGTAMFARGIPTSCFSLALVIDGVSTVGVVYDTFTDNLYTAIKGEGAYRNGSRINVSDIKLDDMRSVCHYDMWPSSKYNIFDVIKELGKKSYFVSIGSIIRASVAVASGEFVACIFPGTVGKNCDIAAVKVIVEEAGGKVTNFYNEEDRYDKDINGAVISNGVVHEEIINELVKSGNIYNDVSQI